MGSKLFVSLLLITLLYGYVNSDGRIYGGYAIDITKAPYMVHVGVVLRTFPNGQSELYNCGGTILRKNLILTAAHCNLNETDGELYRTEAYYINVGSNYNDLTGGTLHSAKNVFVHPKYEGGGDNHFFHDVGLIELADDIELNDRAKLVTLARPGDLTKNGTDGTVTGYGTNPDHKNSRHLFQVHLNVITGKQCVNELAGGTAEEVDKHQICAKAKGKNQCQGDSGGPFHDVSTKRQVGIVSYGATNCTAPKPSILARVTDNLDFIEEIIKRTTPQSTTIEQLPDSGSESKPEPESRPEPESKPEPMTESPKPSLYFWEKIIPTYLPFLTRTSH